MLDQYIDWLKEQMHKEYLAHVANGSTHDQAWSQMFAMGEKITYNAFDRAIDELEWEANDV